MDLFLNEVGSNVWEPQSNSGQEPMAHKYPESLSSLYSRKQPVSRIQVNADGEPVEQTNFEDRPDANLSSHSRFRSDLVQNPTDYRVGTDCVAERAVEPMTNSCPSMAPPSLPITPGTFAPSF